jgi:alkyl hydroperoxide reductase subunit AhpF
MAASHFTAQNQQKIREAAVVSSVPRMCSKTTIFWAFLLRSLLLLLLRVAGTVVVQKPQSLVPKLQVFHGHFHAENFTDGSCSPIAQLIKMLRSRETALLLFFTLIDENLRSLLLASCFLLLAS